MLRRIGTTGWFLFVQPREPEAYVAHLNVVLDWFEELKRRVPPG